MRIRCLPSWFVFLLLLSSGDVAAQLFDNLQLQSSRIPVGDPNMRSLVSAEGPKGIVTTDFDGDGNADVAVANADGAVDVLYGIGDGGFSERLLLIGGAATLRGIVAADFDGDTRPDIATADPFSGELLVYLNAGSGRAFLPVNTIPTWHGARNLIADDFDGDGYQDIVLGGLGNPLRQLAGDGNGGFSLKGEVAEPGFPAHSHPYVLKPVYTLRSFQPVGSLLPKLAVTHANTTTLWILGADEDGVLQVEASLFTDVVNSNFHELHDFEIAPVSGPLNSAVPDLITVSKVSNTVSVWRGKSAAPYFFEEPFQQFAIAGGPRSVKVADTNHDGWGELGIVVRNFNRVLVYENRSGLLKPMADLSSPDSPRDLVMEDFNGDDCADVIVINRKSNDLKFHSTDLESPDGFAIPRQLYTTDADPAGLAVADLDGDGRGEVIQLHRASGDVSVRAAEGDGSLAEPVYYPMGVNSNALAVGDINGDGIPDVSVANLGRQESGGNLTVRHGDGSGGLGELKTITPPVDPNPDPSGPLAPGVFALVQADLDGDGIEDQIVGYFDCRVTFFRGMPDGSYQSTHTVRFVYESRVMVAGDFDQDGDIDIAGAGRTGEGVVLINDGSFFTDENPQRIDFRFGKNSDKNDLRSAVLRDVNNDSDPDLIVASGQGLIVMLGTEGAGFFSAGLIGGENAVSSVASGDFDDDGVEDFAAACGATSRLEIYTGDSGGNYGLALEIDVPSADYIASGDIDGDGKIDLVGTGSVLWTALSGSAPPPAALVTAVRPTLGGLLINEILAKNGNFPIAADGSKTSDAVEVFNSTDSAIDLQNWTLRLVKGNGETREFKVSSSVLVPARDRQVFVCKNGDSAMHTKFKLPAEGGRLVLLDPAANPVESVDYPAMDEDISLARYGDANSSFYFNSYPDIGSQNLDNGVVDPDLVFVGVSPVSPEPDEPFRFSVLANDDVGIALLGVYWRRLDGDGMENGWLPLYDDGMHDDGGMLDGLFAGTIEGGFPDGAELEFYIHGIDLSDAESTLPDSPMFSIPGLPLRNYSLAIGSANDIAGGLQISEVVASNSGAIVDENGEADDWIELRNTGDFAVLLDDFAIGQSTSPTPDEVLRFAPGTTLAPGEYLLIWADGQPEQGALHAPFKLSASGEQVTLIGITELGATAVADGLTWPALNVGDAFVVLGGAGSVINRVQPPSPGVSNLTGDKIEIIDSEDPGVFNFVYPTGDVSGGTTTTAGAWVLEMSGSLSSPGWQPVKSGDYTGIERVFEAPMPLGERRFYRVRLLGR